MIFREALRIAPDYAPTWNNPGNLLLELRRSVEAVEAYDKAVAIDPDFRHAASKLPLSSWQVCDWSLIDAIEGRVCAIMRDHGHDIASPSTCVCWT